MYESYEQFCEVNRKSFVDGVYSILSKLEYGNTEEEIKENEALRLRLRNHGRHVYGKLFFPIPPPTQ